MITATPSMLVFQSVADTPVSVFVVTDTAGPISINFADGSFATASVSGIMASTGTVVITPINPAGGDDFLIFNDGFSASTIPISVGASASPTSPGATKLSDAIAYVRIIADAPTLPSDADITTLLNQSLTEVSDAIDQSLNMVSLPLALGRPTITLPSDIMDIVKIGYSVNMPGVPGSIPYELIELGPGAFMDFQAGVSSNYGLQPGGPVLYYVRTQDTAGRIRLMFSPLPPKGFLNITYHPRASYFVTGVPTSTVNLDQTYFQLVYFKTCAYICMKQRDIARADSFRQQYAQAVGDVKMSVGRRNNARTSVVRDVMSGGSLAIPPWYPM